MEKTTNYLEGKVTIEMTFEEEAAIQVAIIGEIIALRRTIDELKIRNIAGEEDEVIAAAERRIETLETIKREL